ncbi:MAG: helix-turn-helix domain-containing protein [Firmicutes bacterium]|nr:helix-turn-helix domain-containing protein [Bacillota bacterium]
MSPVTVRQYIREGKLFAGNPGRSRYVPADEIVRSIHNEAYEKKQP